MLPDILTIKYVSLWHIRKSQIQNSDTTNILQKRQLHVIKQIHRKLIKNN